jgi:hypothetical protein
MATINAPTLAFLFLLGLMGTAAQPVVLRESARPGEATRVVVELKADGLYRPNAIDGAPEPKPLDLKVETRFEFLERTLDDGQRGDTRRVLRKVIQAASAINGTIRPSASSVRPEVSILIASNREDAVFTFSPAGPLTRSELELVQAPGDPLSLAGLLPDGPVKVGESWPIGHAAARALSDYDALAGNRLNATLTSLDQGFAHVKLAGEIRGAARGGEGTINCDGSFTFDRKQGLITELALKRAEVRKPGPVEAGLDLKSTLTVNRRQAELPPELNLDAVAVAALPRETDARAAVLLFSPPDGRYTLLHDRDWHIFWDDTRLAVLKRLDHGEVVAQCNVAVGPSAGKGRHQDPAQFRDDVRRALGKRFGQLTGEGEVEGASAGGYRYKVSVQGREEDLDILWHYYLVASPDGEQLLVTFTLGEPQAKAFGDQDARLIGSLVWKDAGKGK